ncbi:nitrate reductase [Alteromonas sp. ZYF713]|nr:nitrate reductase [Alteromonas sp. ZYF713]
MNATLPQTTTKQQPADKLVQTTCPYCGVGCGVDVVQSGGMTGSLSELKGSVEHPANYGRLCIKGTHLLETLDGNKRLLRPVVFGQQASWDEATSIIAARMKSIVEQHGPDAVAIYGSGQLLTEDYYVANKLMKGFIGTANIDTNSRLCMSSAVVAHKRAFGEDIVPCNYEDLEHTDLLILTGSNAAWTHPVLFQRIERAKLRNPDMKVVVVDPRETDSCSLADLHVALKPGTDAVLFCGLLNYLAHHNSLDDTFIQNSTNGFAEALAEASTWTVAKVAETCDVPVAEIELLFNWFASLPRAITFFSMGINQSTSGVDKGNAIINCHLASGKIGKEGSGPFSITGQPNAMGGREVGGLSNMLAAHMDIDNPQHHATVKAFWQAPNLITKPGLRAVDMFQAAADGKVKCLWIMATNPAASMPNRALVEAALKNCELVIVSDTAAQTDTLNYAHIALPATGWSEKNGTVTNSERRISRQRGLVEPMDEAKHDWEILSMVGRAMGFEAAFAYQHPAEIFAEHCALTAANNNGSRALDLGPLADLNIAQYDSLRPQQWPLSNTHRIGTDRLFADGSFYTPDGKANFVAITPRLPEQQTSAEYPFVLNTGRVRDQWHTMTRTGNAPRLLKHIDRPWLSIHPVDAQAIDVKDGDLIKAEAACAGDIEVILPVKLDDKQRRGEVFAPFHWSATWGSHARVGALLNGVNDALSGQPELKHGAIKLSPVKMQSYGVIFGDETLVQRLQKAAYYFLKMPTPVAQSIDVADPRMPQEMLSDFLPCLPRDAQWATKQGPDQLSIVVTHKEKLILAVLINHRPNDIPRDWLDSLYSSESLTPEQINGLLEQQPDEEFRLGKVVCSCFGVREKTITHAISQGTNTVNELGKALQCGTNCGSCKTELASLIASTPLDAQQNEETTNEYAL